MKRMMAITMSVIVLLVMISGCSNAGKTDRDKATFKESSGNASGTADAKKPSGVPSISFPQELQEIPENYKTSSEQPGTLLELHYNTYESESYDKKTKTLEKRAIVYLPFQYSDEKQYNVFYLMHGGWSNETTTLGTKEQPSVFKNVIDHAISEGKIKPLIIVCPTYNNLSGSDSGDYSLALKLTRNYHNELVNDLIPAVEGTYSSYAKSTAKEDLIAARNHRGFGGFSMGSVATWRTFEYCLDYFRYFMPMSGSLTEDGSYMDNIVKTSGYDWNDFFIVAITGSADFAAASFEQQINAMQDYKDSFHYADNEEEGNLTYRVKKGYTHDGNAAMEYTYNGLCWFFQEADGNKAAKERDQITEGKQEYRDFLVDNVLHSQTEGDIHYHVYVPDSYDGKSQYALYVTLPGYQGLYFQGVAENIKTEDFAFEAKKYNPNMIILAPQLNDWEEPSARQTIALVEYFLSHYNIDADQVYANGYSGGGETMSLVMGMRPDLFTAYLHCSSKWDGDYETLVKSRTPVYLVIGEADEYYGSKPLKEAYNSLYKLYEKEGLSKEEIDRLLILDIKDSAYFDNQKVSNQHGGGGFLFSHDEEIMGWLFGQLSNRRM